MTLLMVITFLPVIFIAWRYLPETKGLDLAAIDESIVLLEAGI